MYSNTLMSIRLEAPCINVCVCVWEIRTGHNDWHRPATGRNARSHIVIQFLPLFFPSFLFVFLYWWLMNYLWTVRFYQFIYSKRDLFKHCKPFYLHFRKNIILILHRRVLCRVTGSKLNYKRIFCFRFGFEYFTAICVVFFSSKLSSNINKNTFSLCRFFTFFFYLFYMHVSHFI